MHNQPPVNWLDSAIATMFGLEYRDARLSNWQLSEHPEERDKQVTVLTRIDELCKSIGPSIANGEKIIIMGQCGTGKDRLMTSLVRAALLHFRDTKAVRRERGADIWMKIRDSIKMDETEAEILNRFASARLLIVSDPVMPGQEATDFQKDWLYRILERRHATLYPTWFTTNAYDESEIIQAIGAANFSRMMDNARVITCDWSGFRAPIEII